MSSERRPWVWIAAVALLAAVIWWLFPEGSRPNEATSVPEPAEAQATPKPQQAREQAAAAPPEPDAPPDDGEPVAAPLPRDEVVLPKTEDAPDAGVVNHDLASIEEKRDRMLGVVLDRLEEDLRAADEAGDEERAALLRIRIERLEQRRGELVEQ